MSMGDKSNHSIPIGRKSWKQTVCATCAESESSRLFLLLFTSLLPPNSEQPKKKIKKGGRRGEKDWIFEVDMKHANLVIALLVLGFSALFLLRAAEAAADLYKVRKLWSLVFLRCLYLLFRVCLFFIWRIKLWNFGWELIVCEFSDELMIYDLLSLLLLWWVVWKILVFKVCGMHNVDWFEQFLGFVWTGSWRGAECKPTWNPKSVS